MSKNVIYVVAVVLKKRKGSEEFLVVKRPDNDPDFGGHWGFPASTLLPEELPEDAVRRICRIKLGCEGVPEKLLGIMFQKRNNYDIFLMDIEASQKEDTEADISKVEPEEGKTMYVEQKWTTDVGDLMGSAKQGSCCSSIFLTNRGVFSREEWIDSLQGSTIVG
jgi:8-oxo-dGTP diphosphatase